METRIDGNGGCFELDRRSKMSSKLAIKTSKSRPGDRPKSSGDIRISTIYMIVSYERENGRIARRTEIKVKSGLSCISPAKAGKLAFTRNYDIASNSLLAPKVKGFRTRQ